MTQIAMKIKTMLGIGASSLMMLALPASAPLTPAMTSTASSSPTIQGKVVAISATSSGGLIVASNSGGVAADGSAQSYGSTYSDGMTGLSGTKPLAAPIVGMASIPGGSGYYLVGADGGVFNFGSAPYHGSTYTYGITGLSGSHPLNAPIVGMASTPHGNGYWLVAADGGVFNFGSAKFYGSTYTYGITGLSGKRPLNAPIVAMVPTPDGKGYWLVAKDGGVFDFGDAKFYGSVYTYGITGLTGSKPLAAPIVGAAASPSGGGYYLVAADGGVFDFGNAKFDGSAYSIGYTGLGGSNPLPSPVASIAPNPNGNGYWAITQGGNVFAFGGAASLPSVVTTGVPTPQKTITTNALQNPSSNTPMTYIAACNNANYAVQMPDTQACTDAVLQDMNQGRASEGLPNVKLPSNYYSLTRAEQLFVLIDEERVVRGLPPIYGIATALNSSALAGAQQHSDPIPVVQLPTANGAYGSIFAYDYSTAGDVFSWMYNDGPGGTNFDCTPTDPAGCWGHRMNILNSYISNGMSEAMGVASVNFQNGASYMESDAAIFVQISSSEVSHLSYSYTWQQAVAAGA